MDALVQESDEASYSFSNSYSNGIRFVKMIKEVARPCYKMEKRAGKAYLP